MSTVLDKRAVRRSFERAAQSYDAAAILQHEVCRRMLERLDYIRVDPAAILDAGTGTGNAIPGLMSRYPGKPMVAVDLAVGMLERARGRLKWWQNVPGLPGRSSPRGRLASHALLAKSG